MADDEVTPDAKPDALNVETDADTIATRTRTKFSLVDVPIDTLEASLPDTTPDLAVVETEEDREYQRFLSSLLPNEQENLSFLDEEDEEYRPEEEEDEHEDEDARRGISRKELTDLLLDSTHMTFPKLPTAATAALPALEPSRDELLTVDNSREVLPTAIAVDGNLGKEVPVANRQPVNLPRNVPVSVPAVLRGRPGAVTQAQCIQLASQMHKHLQLLLQTYHLLASKQPTPELAECRAMIEELQLRGEKALKDKNSLLSKLNPAMTGSTCGATSEIDGVDINKILSSTDPSGLEGNTGNPNTKDNFLASRRVTRSLTAAHAAVAHPSMFELVGSQTVDELSACFARGCSLVERDRAIQEQMLQLDTHLISAKKRRKSKKGYSTTEDTLLAHGVKRFGTQADSWEQIQKHFLPTKTSQNLRHRFKYLIRPKTEMNAVKALHSKVTLQPHNNSWLLEEDLRIARGLVELHKEKYHFAHLAKKYLPHRSRLEIRKRWERLAAKFRSDLAEIGLTAPDDDSLELAISMKEYLEDKLRNRMLRQKGEAEKAKLDAALQLHLLRQGMRVAFTAHPVGDTVSIDVESALGNSAEGQKKGSDAASCKTKNLHPALFFSSWSFINPAALLNSTCKHNWPSFMNEGDDIKDKLQRNPLATDNEILQLDVKVGDVSGQPRSVGSEQVQEFMPIAMPSDLTSTPTVDKGLGRMPQATMLMDSRMAPKETDEEEDDSDYEHDELLSSENEESDSDFEQMEFTDDDDEVTFEQDSIISDSDDQSAISANSLRTPSQSPMPSPSHDTSLTKEVSRDSSIPSPRTRHPLRLQNLGQPGNERMKRALAALERRIVGKSMDDSALSSVTSSQNGSIKRAKRKVASTLVAPLGVSQTSNAFQLDVGKPAHTATTTTGVDEDDDDDDDDWEDGSGDEEFEVVELPSSSDELASASSDEDEEFVPQQPIESTKPTASGIIMPRREIPLAALSNNALPNKKAKLQQCPTCGHTTCTCSSSERMQLLLRRMKEKRSSSSLQ